MEEEEKEEKKRKRIKTITTFIIITLLSIIIILIGNNKYNLNKTEESNYYKAKIVSVFTDELIEDENEKVERKDISFEAELINKKDEDSNIFGRQILNNVLAKEPIMEGDRVILTRNVGAEIYSFVDYDKSNMTIILLVVFLLLTILIGRWKGFISVISALLNFLIIFLVYIPAVVLGNNIYTSTAILIFYLIFSNLILFNGFEKRVFYLMISSFIIIIILTGIILLFNKMFTITGILNEETILLYSNTENISLDYKGMASVGILIGFLGALVSVNSKIINKIKEELESVDKKDLKIIYNIGVREGREIIHYIINIMFFAYIGIAIPIMLTHFASTKNNIFLFNSEKMLLLIIQIIISYTGILLTLPVTTLVIALFELKSNRNNKKFVQKYSEGLSLNLNKKE